MDKERRPKRSEQSTKVGLEVYKQLAETFGTYKLADNYMAIVVSTAAPEDNLVDLIIDDLNTQVYLELSKRLAVVERDTILGKPIPDNSTRVDLNDEKSTIKHFLCNHRLLAAEEEQMLGRKVRLGQAALEIEASGFTTASVRQSVIDGKASEEDLVRYNQKLVFSIAERSYSNFLSFGDRFQAGNKGILKAIEKFDPERGLKFSTYATWWIRQAITRSLADEENTIRLPVHQSESLRKLQRAKKELERLALPQTIESLVSLTGLSSDKIQQLLEYEENMEIPASIEGVVSDDTDATLEEFVDGKLPSPEEMLINIQDKELLDELLDRLPPREAFIIRERNGLNEEREQRTLDEVGKMLDLTRERIRQIEAVAMNRLKRMVITKPNSNF